MRREDASGRLLAVAGLFIVAGLFVSVFLASSLTVASAQAITPWFDDTPVDDQPGPLITAAGNFTMYFPIFFASRPITFFDPFDDPTSGWPIHALNLNEPYPPGPWSSGYGKEMVNPWGAIDQDVFNVKTVPAWNSWIYTAPVVLADPANFTVQVDGKSAQNFMWASSWGLYVNANAARTQFYTLQIFQNSDGESAPTLEVRRWDYFRGTSDDANQLLLHTGCKPCARGDFEWTRVTIERIGAGLYIRIGTKLYGVPAAEYVDVEHAGVGLYQGNFEWNDFNPLRYSLPTFQFDNFMAQPVYHR